MKRYAQYLLAFFLAEQLFGHAILLNPPPRNNRNQIKVCPCGGVPMGNSPTILVAGQPYTVTWTEFVDHPGYYKIFFSPANDQNFIELAKIIDNQNGGDYSYTIPAFPNTPTDHGTLQLIQYMTETDPPGLYCSCADIKVVTGVAPPPPPAPPMPPPVMPPAPPPGLPSGPPPVINPPARTVPDGPPAPEVPAAAQEKCVP